LPGWFMLVDDQAPEGCAGAVLSEREAQPRLAHLLFRGPPWTIGYSARAVDETRLPENFPLCQCGDVVN